MEQHSTLKRPAVAGSVGASSAMLNRSSAKNYTPLWTPHVHSTSGDSTFPPPAPPVLPAALLREYDHASVPRNPSFPKRLSDLDCYMRFGEECASRNLVPSYRLFEHWMRTDIIAKE